MRKCLHFAIHAAKNSCSITFTMSKEKKKRARKKKKKRASKENKKTEKRKERKRRRRKKKTMMRCHSKNKKLKTAVWIAFTMKESQEDQLPMRK